MKSQSFVLSHFLEHFLRIAIAMMNSAKIPIGVANITVNILAAHCSAINPVISTAVPSTK